jgi:hypothetical protein
MPYAHADGPPVHPDGTIIGKHISFEIDEKQISEVEKTHIINLTDSQHSLLKKYLKYAPKTFVVVTPDYNDCTCDMLYLIWNTTNTVVLPLGHSWYSEAIPDNKDDPYDNNELLKNWNKEKIIIDTKGNIYFDSKRLNKVALATILKRTARAGDSYAHWLFISVPPYRETEYEGTVLRKIKEIEKAAKKYKVRTEIGG